MYKFAAFKHTQEGMLVVPINNDGNDTTNEKYLLLNEVKNVIRLKIDKARHAQSFCDSDSVAYKEYKMLIDELEELCSMIP